MKHGRLMLLLPLILLGGCLQHVIHQGNVLKPGLVFSIQPGDTRFHVESVLGSPMLKDDLHPDRAIYVEEYFNPDSGKKFTRRVEITYDEAGRVKGIKRYGFPRR